MTQKRAKENENPEPQTGRGHKLTDRLGIGSWGTKNSRIARTRHTATTGTLRERTLRRGPAGGRRRGGRCRHQSPARCTRHQGTLSAPVWAPATERADGPRCRQGCGGTGTLTDRGGGLRRGALSAEATYKPTARAGHPTPGRRPQSGARPHADLREDVPAATVPAPNQAASAHAAGWAGGPGGPPSAEG